MIVPVSCEVEVGGAGEKVLGVMASPGYLLTNWWMDYVVEGGGGDD
jgi:hypothetical protein